MQQSQAFCNFFYKIFAIFTIHKTSLRSNLSENLLNLGSSALNVFRPPSYNSFMRDIYELFAALSRSKFRCRFKLGEKETMYIRQKSLPTILEHAYELITARLAPAAPPNDGRQTPTKNHPVFIAQHATATCCRKCLKKWHNIPQGRPLTKKQVKYILLVIEHWLHHQKIQTSHLKKVNH